LTITPLAVAFAIGGALWGLGADRISVRWPAHDEGFVARRRIGWRTAVVAGFGAIGFGALPSRFDDPITLAILTLDVAALTLLLATDLDQRLLPDRITLPLIPVALVYAASGQNPLVGNELILALAAALLIPAVLYLPSLAFGPGAFGIGDVKLLVSVGLVSGAYRALVGTFAGILLSGIVIVVLLATRRITLRSFIPFGPFLIIGALWAILLRPA